MSKILDKDNRKNVLLISDHIGLDSGVGNMSEKIVGGTSHRLNWYCVGGNAGDNFEPAEVNPDYFDNCLADDHEVVIYPHSKYGDSHLTQTIIEEHDIDVVLIFGDPHNFYWLVENEDKFSDEVSFLYYHVWDNLPVPEFNKTFYDFFDWIGSVSRLTHHIVSKLHNGSHDYVPHGADSDVFYPITEDLSKVIEKDGERVSEYQIIENMRAEWFESEENFTVFWCNRNIQRKNAPDVIRAFSKFVDFFPDSQREEFNLLMRTNHKEKTGPNLTRVIDYFAPDLNIRIIPEYVSKRELNWYYNISDVTINIANREGFGLPTLESMMAGTPILVNVTGGLQDQCGFKKSNGEFLSLEDYEEDWGSNSDGRFKESGRWAFPIWPKLKTLSGTQGEPYCYDEYVDINEVVEVLKDLYLMGEKEKSNIGMKGRTYAMEYFSSDKMVNLLLKSIENN